MLKAAGFQFRNVSKLGVGQGFWSITLSSEVSTDITVKSSKASTPIKASVKASDGYQVATEKNWTEIIQKSLQLYVEDLKAKLN